MKKILLGITAAVALSWVAPAFADAPPPEKPAKKTKKKKDKAPGGKGDKADPGKNREPDEKK